MSVVQLDVDPGVVSTVYFIVLEIFMLAIVDVVLIHIVSWMYYKRIHKGIPLEVRSAEIPGVATSLVGRFVSPPNIFAYLIKLALLACVFVVDLNIKSTANRSRTALTLTAKFGFDPSDDAWNGLNRIVERTWTDSGDCHIIDKQNSNITFYSIAFNLKNNETIDDEIVPADSEFRIKRIDVSSVQCLAEDRVFPPDPSHIVAQVIGCSQLVPSTCTNESIIERSADLRANPADQKIIFFKQGTIPITYRRDKYDVAAKQIWPSYSNPKLTCLQTHIGIKNIKKRYEACIVTAQFSNDTTLIERWDYDRREGKLKRRYPGPVFKGRVEFGVNRISVYLEQFAVSHNWASLSRQVVADSTVYQLLSEKGANQPEIVRLGENEILTTVPVFTVVLTVFLVMAAAAARLAVLFSIGKDLRPHLNTINGLSSVGREENEPTGRSMQAGHGMIIGLTKRDGHSVHFGPLTSQDKGVARERGVIIE